MDSSAVCVPKGTPKAKKKEIGEDVHDYLQEEVFISCFLSSSLGRIHAYERV